MKLDLLAERRFQSRLNEPELAASVNEAKARARG